jgi:hypothetical protein
MPTTKRPLEIVPHSTLNGRRTYKTADGRYSISSAIVSKASLGQGRRRTSRFWTAYDLVEKELGTDYPRAVVFATTLERLLVRLAARVEKGSRTSP